MRLINAAEGLDAKGRKTRLSLSIENGRIARITDAAGAAEDIIVMPALVNAHDHARPLRSSSVGAFGKPLETWLHRLAMMAPVDPYLATLAPLARAALGGQGAVMIHHVRAMGLTDYAKETEVMARAARDVGVRVALGIGMRDCNPLVYGAHDELLASLEAAVRAEIEARFLSQPMMPIKEQIERVDAVAAALGSPMFDVQYAPNGPQWCSEALWEAIAEASARTGRRITTHLYETKYQRAWADRSYPQGMLKRWKEIGLLSPRLTLAHCVWATPDELDMIAEAGCTIVTNTSSNLALRSGIAPLAEMLKRCCKVAMGIDGQAFDEDDDALREIRLLWSLHAGWGFDRAFEPSEILLVALENGRGAVGAGNGGRLAEGAAADLLILDRAALDEDGLMPVDPIELLFARGNRSHLRELIVAGRSVVQNGKLVGVDLDAAQRELRAAYRAAMPSRAGFVQAWTGFEKAVCAHYLTRLGCC
ncbi:MAG: amidohydrolase family protein [Alphaproteobacteria bacterium]|nr:amidohydrolase family protein [Alphaproteobacteria bacterium]